MTIAARSDLFLSHRQFFARCNKYLPLDQVDTRDHFGDWVFNLQTSVHFEEEKIVVLVDELNGAGVVITNSFCCFDSSCAHCFFHAVWQTRCWGFFNQFLVTSLRRAVARRNPHNISMFVANELYFNVAWPCEVALNINFVATKESF